MEVIEAPRWVKEQLLEGERVTSKLSQEKADYYATDKRLLRLTIKSNCEALEYKEMSVTLEKYGGAWHIFRGVLVVLGIIAVIVSFVGEYTFQVS